MFLKKKTKTRFLKQQCLFFFIYNTSCRWKLEQLKSAASWERVSRKDKIYKEFS